MMETIYTRNKLSYIEIDTDTDKIEENALDYMNRKFEYVTELQNSYMPVNSICHTY